MGTLNGWDDAFEAGELVACTYGFIIVDGENLLTTFLGKVGMHWSDTRIVETCRDGEGFLYLSVFVLHYKGACSMQYSLATAMNGGCCVVGVDAMSASLSKYNLHTCVINIMIYGAGSVASSTYTSYEVVRIVAPNLFFELLFYLLRDNALHLGNNIWIWMWSHG